MELLSHSEQARRARRIPPRMRARLQEARWLSIVARLSEGPENAQCLTQTPYRPRSSEEVRAHDRGERVKIEKRQKVDCTEFAIDRRWSTDLCTNCQICAQ